MRWPHYDSKFGLHFIFVIQYTSMPFIWVNVLSDNNSYTFHLWSNDSAMPLDISLQILQRYTCHIWYRTSFLFETHKCHIHFIIVTSHRTKPRRYITYMNIKHAHSYICKSQFFHYAFCPRLSNEQLNRSHLYINSVRVYHIICIDNVLHVSYRCVLLQHPVIPVLTI